jgi:hypothetical protein
MTKSSKIRKIAQFAGPAAAFIPGVGPLLAAGIGAAGGALSGGGLKGALLGGATGGLAGMAAPAIKAGFGGLSSALSGGGGGIASALSGAGKSILGSAAGSPLTGGLQGATQGSGLLGALTGGGSAGGLAGAGKTIASYALPASSIFSGIQSYGANKDMEEQLLAAQGRAADTLSPYLQSGYQANDMLTGKLASGELGGTFNPGDLTQDPGYQFRLSQGQDAIDRKNAATGNYFSGAALKEAQEYGQGLADQTYNDAYSRWLQGQQNTYGMLAGQSGQGLNTAGGMSNIYMNQGNVRANATAGKTNAINQTLASLLRGRGALDDQYAYGAY